jgi:hypothetical protein
MLLRIPDQSLLVGTNSTRAPERIEATRASDGAYAFIYTATGKPFTADLSKLTGDKLRAWWYDPRTGKAQALGELPRDGTHEFTPPSGAGLADWVLVLDDSSRKFAPPGHAG